MGKKFDMPEVIAVFPLPGALLLPRSRLPLHIFEPRYLAMLEDALKTPERLIGMVQPNKVPGRDGHGLHQIGCAGRVTQFSETEDGRYLITLSGMSRFRVLREVNGFTPYRRCEVSWTGFERDLGRDETDTGFDRESFMNLLSRYFTARELQTDWEGLQEADDELLINSLSMLLDFDPEDKQALLEAPCLSTRRETLVTLIEYSLRGGDGEEIMQ
ncbi:MAG: LON peptidase substrate-binding domain-containing protein [Paracoccaceae bacterium]|jgi:Lon protease-like protein|uniref:LON peptidase substrate-binding domain-containing protein n=1 Tax=unclassified Seohaeicola TaxID=2641111 RepID=UPI00237ADC6E|nr:MULTISPECIES: LON peptidase substrate-binding domain-containing protein [unclassified Seohaeicola]MDD9706573.1 LON peptidase substrate-binding domain-containing protein [Seohaeicola sp. 4SK31]MDD9734279.1 LON peptidase substrate-binding domain-containing protein [Seohaeicola sp. SP36]MDF1706635.1 LON peptidase substrate-binding domain-containing protein [Paracoccaceae bacterium]MDM7968375.1 LON peptidase substrate-binding domain-containing protein [Paracoccaceae bacterium]